MEIMTYIDEFEMCRYENFEKISKYLYILIPIVFIIIYTKNRIAFNRLKKAFENNLKLTNKKFLELENKLNNSNLLNESLNESLKNSLKLTNRKIIQLENRLDNLNVFNQSIHQSLENRIDNIDLLCPKYYKKNILTYIPMKNYFIETEVPNFYKMSGAIQFYKDYNKVYKDGFPKFAMQLNVKFGNELIEIDQNSRFTMIFRNYITLNNFNQGFFDMWLELLKDYTFFVKNGSYDFNKNYETGGVSLKKFIGEIFKLETKTHTIIYVDNEGVVAV